MEDNARHRSSSSTAVLHLPQCKLVVVKGPGRGREYVVSSDVVRIGKAEENDLVLPEETVSRMHMEILRDAKGYLVRDLHSTNGTFLDGAEVREAYIRPGSILTVGNVQLKFQPFEERIEVVARESDELGEMYGRSAAMRALFALLEQVAPLDATVLVEGEPGSGKDLVARTLQALSKRASGPLVPVDCRGASSTVEATLFGHDKGAFPGASTARQGAFELAQGGTLYLDHVDELGLELQAKLLRVVEQREAKRLGSTRGVKLDLRVVAATERDLRREVEKGRFRDDLYQRLARVVVHVPALRERKEDIPALAARFLARAHGGEAPALDEATLARLAAHDWPGNVRELRSVVERGLFAGGPLPETTPRPASAPTEEFDPQRSYREVKESWEWDFERRYLRWLLGRAEGNISRAAREADMDRKYLHKLLKKHRIV